MKTVKQLKEERGALIEKLASFEAIVSERSFTETENTDYEKSKKDIEDLNKRIQILEEKESRGTFTISKEENKDPFKAYSLVRAGNISMGKAALDGAEAELDKEARNIDPSRSYNGIAVHPGIFMRNANGKWEKRDQTVTGSSGAEGGYTVQTNVSASVVEALRSRLVLAQAGATLLGNLIGNLDIPRNGGFSVAWASAENSAASETTSTLTRLQLSPKRITAIADISRQLMLQSNTGIEDLFRRDFLNAVAVKFQEGAIEGGGTGEPTGLLSAAINAVYAGGATASGTNASGAFPVWADVINLEKEIQIDNADTGSLAYLMHPKLSAKLKTTARVSSTDSVFIMDPREMGKLNGYDTFVTTSVPADLAKGAASGASALLNAFIFGNFNDLILASWGAFDLTIDPYTSAASGLNRMIVHSWVDAGVRRLESFAAIKDAKVD